VNIANYGAFLIGAVNQPTPLGGLSLFPFPRPVVLFGAQQGSPATVQKLGDVLIFQATNATENVQGTVWGREYSLLQGVNP
jgi:hypothetical protein